MAPYDITRPGGMLSTRASTASTYAAGSYPGSFGADGSWEGTAAAYVTMAGVQSGERTQIITMARRVVVKVGSSSLTTTRAGLDRARLDAFTDALAGHA